MASKQANVDFLLEQLADAGEVSARKMFGEYAIYRGGKVVALFCDDQLFVKPTLSGRAFIGKVKEAAPYPGAKPCFLISGDRWENADWLCELIRITDLDLPAAKPKAKRATPKAKRATPKAKRATPKAKHAAPKAKRATPKSKRAP